MVATRRSRGAAAVADAPTAAAVELNEKDASANGTNDVHSNGSNGVRPSTASSAASESARFPIGVFLLSLLAYPVCYILSLTSAMNDSRLVFAAGVVICSSIAPLAYYLVVRRTPAGRDIYFYIFTVFAFTSMVDLFLATSIDGLTDTVRFYLDEGERYLRSPHGLWINVWDGTYHYVCYLVMTALLLRRSHSYSSPLFRTVGLLWAGSILNSMIVLFAGSAMGIHAAHIKPSYLLNIPYALFPLTFFARVINARPKTSDSVAVTSTKKRTVLQLCIDVILLALLFVGMCLCVFRALAVLTSRLPIAAWYAQSVETHLLDPTAYPQIQMLTYAFYYTPYLIAAVVWLLSGGGNDVASTESLRDWSLFFAGALMQGTFSYVGAAFHSSGGYPYPQWLPQITDKLLPFTTFLSVNVLLLSLPFLMLARIHFTHGRDATAKKQL